MKTLFKLLIIVTNLQSALLMIKCVLVK